jgi:hypothetical protein
MEDSQPVNDGSLGDDLSATIGARRELGDGYDTALVQSFLEKVDREIVARVDRELEAKAPNVVDRNRARPSRGSIAIPSIALGIPVTAIITSQQHGLWGFLGVAASWGAIAVVNLTHAWGRRRG